MYLLKYENLKTSVPAALGLILYTYDCYVTRKSDYVKKLRVVNIAKNYFVPTLDY